MRIEVSKAQTYIESLSPAESLTKQKSRHFAEELGLEKICLSASEGQLLSLFVRLHGCRKFVEIGTLTGLSAQYILEGMQNQGRLWTLEKTELHAQKAQEAMAEHEGIQQVQFVVGDARKTLLELESQGPFDGIFIDGNKAAYGDYLNWAEKNLRKGGLIIADNVFLSGAVWGEAVLQKFSEKQIKVLQEFNQRLANPEFYESSLVPTAEGATCRYQAILMKQIQCKPKVVLIFELPKAFSVDKVYIGVGIQIAYPPLAANNRLPTLRK